MFRKCHESRTFHICKFNKVSKNFAKKESSYFIERSVVYHIRKLSTDHRTNERTLTMGISGSKTTSSSKKKDTAKKRVKTKQQKLRGNVKILLAGTSASGKTTIAKQLRIITTDGDPFDASEKEVYKKLIRYNLINNFGNIGILLKRYEEEERNLKDSGAEISTEARSRFRKARGILPRTLMNLTQIQVCKYDSELANDDNQELFATIRDVCRDENLLTNFAYELTYIRHYIDNIDRVMSPEYVPTQDDILRVRQRSTGYTDLSFIKDKILWEIFDAGGQLAERRKWEPIANSNGINAIVFCMSLADCQDINQESNKTYLVDTLDLFKKTIRESWDTNKALIVFMNKTDLFKERLEKGVIKLRDVFPSYTGSNTYLEGIALFENTFKDILREANKNLADTTIYPTCALDTDQTKVVLDAVTDNLISQRLENF